MGAAQLWRDPGRGGRPRPCSIGQPQSAPVLLIGVLGRSSVGLGGLPASPATAEQLQGCALGVRGTSASRCDCFGCKGTGTSHRDSCLVLFHASPASQGQMLNLLHLDFVSGSCRNSSGFSSIHHCLGPPLPAGLMSITLFMTRSLF